MVVLVSEKQGALYQKVYDGLGAFYFCFHEWLLPVREMERQRSAVTFLLLLICSCPLGYAGTLLLSRYYWPSLGGH